MSLPCKFQATKERYKRKFCAVLDWRTSIKEIQIYIQYLIPAPILKIQTYVQYWIAVPVLCAVLD